MNSKIIFSFLVLALLVSAVPFALADDLIEVGDEDNDTGRSLVEEGTGQATPLKAVSRLHLVANGIAVKGDDELAISRAKIVIGAVKVRATEDDNTDLEYVLNRVGVLMAGKAKYHVRDIAVSLDEVSGEIYAQNRDANGAWEPAGEMVLNRFQQPGLDVWAGTAVIGEGTYSLYFLSVRRNFALSEIVDRLGAYCEANPGDGKCQAISEMCDSNTEMCRARVADFCKENTSNAVCLRLKKQYCLNNASDERCMQYLERLCESNPNQSHCRVASENGEPAVYVNTGRVKALTAEAGETVRELAREKARSLVTQVKNSISSAWTNRKGGS